MLNAAVDVLDASSPPGRAVLDGLDLQVAVLGGLANVAQQARAIEGLAATLRSRGVSQAPAIRRLPEVVHASELATTGHRGVVIGMADDTLGSVAIDPSGIFLIAGPPGSGRTTTLAAICSAVTRSRVGSPAFYLGNRRSPLPRALNWTETADSPDLVSDLAMKLSAQLATAPPSLIVIEGLTDFLSGPAEMALQEMLKVVKVSDHLLIADSETSTLSQSWPLVQAVRSARRGLALQPDQSEGDSIFRTSFPRLSRAEFPPGRGLLVEGGKTRRIQVAIPD
jgi:S-DNA-T family DNA segregation ATPase FtsK/SpoIIIE